MQGDTKMKYLATYIFRDTNGRILRDMELFSTKKQAQNHINKLKDDEWGCWEDKKLYECKEIEHE